MSVTARHRLRIELIKHCIELLHVGYYYSIIHEMLAQFEEISGACFVFPEHVDKCSVGFKSGECADHGLSIVMLLNCRDWVVMAAL